MTIYIDIIFLENLFMNYIIFFASSTILKLPLKIIRLSLASVLGSIYAVTIYISKMEIFSNMVFKIVLSIMLVYIAFAPKNIKELLKHLMIFYLTSFTFGGVAFALLYFVQPQEILFNNRFFGRNISDKGSFSWTA